MLIAASVDGMRCESGWRLPSWPLPSGHPPMLRHIQGYIPINEHSSILISGQWAMGVRAWRWMDGSYSHSWCRVRALRGNKRP